MLLVDHTTSAGSPDGRVDHCWKAQQERADAGDEIVDAVGEFTFSTNPALLKELVAKAVLLYEASVAAKSPKAQLLPLLRKQIKAGRSDVLHHFFRHLTRGPREHTSKVVREITATPEWKSFARRAVKRQPARKGRKS